MKKWIYYIVNISLIAIVFIYFFKLGSLYVIGESGYLSAKAILLVSGIALAARLAKIIYDDSTDARDK